MMTPLPLGVTLAMALSCGALPLMAEGIYVPAPMPQPPERGRIPRTCT